MNTKLSLMSFLLINLILMISCSTEELTETSFNDPQDDQQALTVRTKKADQQVVVMAAPKVSDSYYAPVFEDIVDFQVNYANEIEGRDLAIILVNNATRPYYEGRVPDYVLVNGNMEDIWIRDFGAVVADKQVKFKFLPDYMDRQDARAIDNAYKRWMNNNQLDFGKSSSIILDGGNVVDNGDGRVIITDRILYDNPQLTKKSAKKKLKKLLGAQQIAIIPETPGDATGHSDGMVMWATNNKILLQEHTPAVQQKIIKELKRSFPGVEIVILKDYYEDEEWEGFSSACNIFVNALVTNKYIYVPTFNMGQDNEMIQLIQSHTDKTVIEIPAEQVCFMGGSVRCLTWNVDGQMAEWLLEE